MLKPSTFSEEVLDRTLDAVRVKRRNRVRNRSTLALVAVAGIFAGVYFSSERSDLPVQVVRPEKPPAPPALRVFQTARASGGSPPMISTFTTGELQPKIMRINDEELNRMLAGQPHAIFSTPDGHTRFWMPELADANH